MHTFMKVLTKRNHFKKKDFRNRRFTVSECMGSILKKKKHVFAIGNPGVVQKTQKDKQPMLFKIRKLCKPGFQKLTFGFFRKKTW